MYLRVRDRTTGDPHNRPPRNASTPHLPSNFTARLHNQTFINSDKKHVIQFVIISMTKWTEASMQSALAAIENGQSIRKAVSAFDIPRNTLAGRLAGAQTFKETSADRQLLSEAQEKALAHWIEIRELLGQAPTHQQVRLCAAAILRQAGRSQSPGKCWVRNFFMRNPQIGTKEDKRLDLKRVRSVSPDRIKGIFEVLASPLLQHVRPSQCWNMDETGIAEGVGSNGKHVGIVSELGERKAKWCYVKGRQDGSWVSIIEYINAAGDFLPPAVIYTGKNVQQQWFSDEVKGLAPWRI